MGIYRLGTDIWVGGVVSIYDGIRWNFYFLLTIIWVLLIRGIICQEMNGADKIVTKQWLSLEFHGDKNKDWRDFAWMK